MVEGEQFLIQSPSPDWVRKKIFLSHLRDSAVNLISPHSTVLGRQCSFNQSLTGYAKKCRFQLLIDKKSGGK